MLHRKPVTHTHTHTHGLQSLSSFPVCTVYAMRKSLFCWLETGFNENTQVKQLSATTDFNRPRLHCEFIYNNAPDGTELLALIYIDGILSTQEAGGL